MSKYLEYMKLLPKGLANIDKVFEGIVNETKLKYKTLSEDQQEEIIRRRVICQACPLNSINALESKEYKDLFGVNYKTDREDEHCSICSCNIALKTSSISRGFSFLQNLASYSIETPNLSPQIPPHI